MAMRFMKVKRVVIPFLTLVIMLSQLSGCAVATPEDIVDLPSEVTLVIEEAELTGQNEVKQYDTDNKQYDTDSKHEKGEIGKEEMLRLFEQFYSDYKKDKGSMDNEMFLVNWTPMPCKSIGTAEDATVYNQIEMEIEFTSIDKQLPADGFQQYVKWRTQQEQKVSTPSEIPQQPKVAKTTLSSEPAREEPPVAPVAPKYSSDSGIETDWSLWDAEGEAPSSTAQSSYGFS
jgi:hypothetical protein